jgi:hypothetical protein
MENSCRARRRLLTLLGACFGGLVVAPGALHINDQRMKPLSGLAADSELFGFFGTSAIDAESVRVLRMVSPEPGEFPEASLHPRAGVPSWVTQGERNSLAPPPVCARVAQFPVAIPPFTHATVARPISWRASPRCDTEYINAAREDTATASSRTASNSSPTMSPRWRSLCA